MLEIVVILAALLGMAKRKGRRKFRRYLRGNINMLVNLGSTLAANTGIRFITGGTVLESAFLSSVRATYTMKSYTQIEDAGPILVFLCHSDFTLAEVEAYIEASGSESWDEGNIATKEIMTRGRRIRPLGAFQRASGVSSDSSWVLNEGRPVTTKCNWMLRTGQGVIYVFYNTGSAALATTDPEVNINGHANLWPR